MKTTKTLQASKIPHALTQNAARKLRSLACLLTLAALPARAAEYLWLYDGERPIHAEVVYRDEDRARGLMYRPWLAPYSGMLFIFDPPQAVAFWMKNTLIPLEMRFYDVRGERITRHLARPCSKPPCAHYPAHGQTAYVLETRARYRLVAPPYPLQILPALPHESARTQKKTAVAVFFTSALKPRPATLHINTLKLLIGFTGINNALYQSNSAHNNRRNAK